MFMRCSRCGCFRSLLHLWSLREQTGGPGTFARPQSLMIVTQGAIKDHDNVNKTLICRIE